LGNDANKYSVVLSSRPFCHERKTASRDLRISPRRAEASAPLRFAAARFEKMKDKGILFPF
jgi:hypothetical protein